MEETLVAVAGGSGFIGRAIIRRLAAMPGFRVRALSRDPGATSDAVFNLKIPKTPRLTPFVQRGDSRMSRFEAQSGPGGCCRRNARLNPFWVCFTRRK